ncbi:hypothetical protein [Streptomyces sp. enrichment culture]|uniref:hypothetical protein n=1 Tax=Streptomyces sp. enrichment culture TaxID=1795815 RepID=UPI003F564CFE
MNIPVEITYTRAMDNFMRTGIAQLRTALSEVIDPSKHLKDVLDRAETVTEIHVGSVMEQQSSECEITPLIVPPEWTAERSMKSSSKLSG